MRSVGGEPLVELAITMGGVAHLRPGRQELAQSVPHADGVALVARQAPSDAEALHRRRHDNHVAAGDHDRAHVGELHQEAPWCFGDDLAHAVDGAAEQRVALLLGVVAWHTVKGDASDHQLATQEHPDFGHAERREAAVHVVQIEPEHLVPVDLTVFNRYLTQTLHYIHNNYGASLL